MFRFFRSIDRDLGDEDLHGGKAAEPANENDDPDLGRPMQGFERAIGKIMALTPAQREDLLKRGIVPQEETPDEPRGIE